MTKGNIKVKTENIFPIIKKFLYSDHEIFLRELVSNAIDATQKLRALSSMGEYKGELGDLTIDVILDKESKTLTVKDRGIGMTAEEIEKYINQIAISSAEDFVKKYKGKSEQDQHMLIGHFGLGFYSSFMVSSKVEILSKSYRKGPGSKAVRWLCDGSPEYEITERESQPGERGTEVILHIADDSHEFLDDSRILGLLKKYCRFLPVPIRFGMEEQWVETPDDENAEGEEKHEKGKWVEKERIINDTNPLWKQKPSGLKDEDYLKFYRELYPGTFEEPLFQIHLNVDYPFNLTGILYFPRVKKYTDIQRNKIQLFCNQVFVTDSVEGVVPDFLTLLHGVIDSPDIPLNVSRSFLQSDSNVKKISGHITKKVADKLEELFKNNREDFEKKWDDIKVFILYGMISEDKFFERAEKFCLLKNTENKYFTFEEYASKVRDLQTEKSGNTVYLYANDPLDQHAFIQAALDRGFDTLLFDGPIDNHFINTLETKHEKVRFKRVDSETIDKLIPKEEPLPPVLSDEEQQQLRPLFEENIEKEKFTVVFESLPPEEMPVMITQPEFMRRMKDMAAFGSGYSYMKEFPDHYNLVINANHELIRKIRDTEDEQTKTRLARQACDLAMLTQNLLKGEDLTNFVKRSVKML